jgi:hypothetical protein
MLSNVPAASIQSAPQEMSFSYNESMDPWEPMGEEGHMKIRILELHPLPWYLRWVPRSWELYIPLRASLAWAPLAKTTIAKRNSANLNVDNPSSTSDTTSLVDDGMTSGENSMNQAMLGSKPSSLYPPYNALSYTWGDGKAKSDIRINEKSLTVTLSLATALYHLRPRSKPLRIWIDQISINQQDLQEKTEQVQHMDRIYRNTEEALVWLGPAQSGSEALMHVLTKLGTFAEHFQLYSYYTKAKYPELLDIMAKENPEDPKTVEYHAFCDSVMDDFTYSFFESLIVFYNLQWFRRAWVRELLYISWATPKLMFPLLQVIQEFSLPPKVTFVYGTRRIGAETLMCVSQMIMQTFGPRIIEEQPQNHSLIALMDTWVEHSSNIIKPFFTSRQRRKKWDEGEQEGASLYTMLHRVCVEGDVQATQACDIVYGLLGVVNDAERLRIRAEYSEADQQVQAAITYTKTARAIIKSGKVDLLMSAQHVKTDMTLPSWVPDWRSALSQSFAENNKQQKFDSVAIAMCRKMEKDGTLPSWVPDWRLVLRRSFTWLGDEKAEPVFEASNKQPLRIHEEGDDRILVLDGYIVDEIEDLGAPWTGGRRIVEGTSSRFPHEEYLSLLAQVRQMCLVSKAKGHAIYSTSERADDACWLVPCGGLDQMESYQATRAGPACKLKYEHCLAELQLLIEVYAMTMTEYEVRAAELAEMGKRRVDEEDTGRNTGTLYRTRMHEMVGKRPFISNIGYVGMGPSYMRSGDKIVILNGASVPFIVRPVDEGKFRLMGECYCDGIMFGEFIQTGGQVQKITLL